MYDMVVDLTQINRQQRTTTKMTRLIKVWRESMIILKQNLKDLRNRGVILLGNVKSISKKTITRAGNPHLLSCAR